jgi:hypothetical protein
MTKTIDIYGVQLTSEQEMLFSKYIANHGIAMNTKTPEERKKIVTNWLSSIKSYMKPFN